MKYKYIACAAALVIGPAIIAVPPMLIAAENTPWAYPVAPKGAPKRDPNKIVTQPDIRAKLKEDGADVTPLSVDQFTAFVRAESEKYLAIIKDAGVKPE